ncbi:UDP-glucose:glycoprotein glucosyltransferase-domain-containing protein [Spinellus fusiger]|nr:UDP-glucose:glycoprotein glucosyltransferase-domain-containing protein [Spinellus fusiger]
MQRKFKHFLSLAVISTWCLGLAVADSPPVELTLVAPWSAPHLSIEIAETVAMENTTAYFSLLSHLSQQPLLTPQQQYQKCMQALTEQGLSPQVIDYIQLSLSLHTATPRIEAHYQLYQSTLPKLANYDPECKVWVQLKDRQLCTLEELQHALKTLGKSEDLSEEIPIFPFDHTLHPKQSTGNTVVLYTSEFSTMFEELHTFLVKAVEEYSLSYVLRYKPSSTVSKTPLYLTGYGVGLDLKNTDYLVIDDKATEENRQSQLGGTLSSLGRKVSQALFESNEAKLEPLTAEEVHELGIKATHFIVSSENPLLALSQLSQDFPKYAKSISQVVVDDHSVQEIMDNQASTMQEGGNAIWFNGLFVETEQVDAFYILRALKRERELMNSFKSLGFTSRQTIEFITSPLLASDEREDSNSIKGVYDVRDEKEVVVWWNNIEKDSRYKGWSDNLMDIVRHAYSGQLRPIRKNIYNLFMVENIASIHSLKRIKHDVQDMVKRGTPICFGVLPIVNINDSKAPSTMAAKLIHYITKEYGRDQAIEFLTKIHDKLEAKNQSEASSEIIEEAFLLTIATEKSSKKNQDKTLEQIMEEEQAYIQNVNSFSKRLGVGKENENVVFLNGKYLEYNEEEPWPHVVSNAISEQTRMIASHVYYGKMTADVNVYEYLVTLPSVEASRNPYITVSKTKPLRFLPLHKNYGAFDSLHYLQSNEDASNVNTNMWVVANLNSVQGLQMAMEALKFVETNSHTRVSLIHNPDAQLNKNGLYIEDTSDKASFSDVWYSQIHGKITDISKVKDIISAAIESQKQENESNLKFVEKIKAFAPGTSIVRMFTGEESKDVKYVCDVLKQLEMEDTFTGIIVNGRVIGPFSQDTEFIKENFEALTKFELQKRTQPLLDTLEKVQDNLKPSSLADTVSTINTILGVDKVNTKGHTFEQVAPSERHRPYENIKGDYTSITLGDKETAFLEIAVLLDPLSETAQKLSEILKTVSELKDVYIKIYMNPRSMLSEIPIKRFYRYVFNKELHFDPTSGDLDVSAAYFSDLPKDSLYTLSTDVIRAWHVTVKDANMDLDNIQLSSLSTHQSSVSAVYELEYILLEGHCIDSVTRGPPRSLQFVLGTEKNPATTDTTVMANLGYFQLKAQPGVWRLELREGRSSEVYHLERVDYGEWKKNSHESTNITHVNLPLTSFEGLTVFPQVKKNPGMEKKEILEEDETHRPSSQSGGIKNSLWSLFTSKFFKDEESKKDTQVQNKPKQAEINIFSVASGQLYERFMSIMILSVLEHTESTVKFWFIENFLSPSFKKFLPEMAKEHNFEYEMVTYKWPSWLRGQKEKQRTIWGYKILFLDVLFPLNLDKVIFVDADQVVRTDMKELVDLDLKGAPYGYTPFCSDRTEMDGFRFWTKGYWKEHLAELPYHISALYVVDLVRFRQLAAGDRLRAQYQQLSADPNSLANLDQDLPNNMQHVVPIHSLPQEWLWCETWCSDESLKTAKTIDLCNNPLTKEPKLDRARRQLPEWTVYDQKVSDLKKKIASISSQITSTAATTAATTTTATTAACASTHVTGILESILDQTVGGDFEDIIDVLEDPPLVASPKRDEL